MQQANTRLPSWQLQAIAEVERRNRENPPETAIAARDWSDQFYIPETEQPIELMLHQCAILQLAFPSPDVVPYQTVVYSTVKKSGKTAMAGYIARWAAETWGSHQEILCLANDQEQAAGRIFKAARASIELTPGYDGKNRVLPGVWLVREREMTHIPSRSTIRALAADYKGEAGGNPSLSLWSELWGYEHERMERLWDELTPSPVRPVSMRWVETYAGYTGESKLLFSLYEQGVKRGQRLTVADLDAAGVEEPDRAFAEATKPTDTVPIWVNDGLLCYWDTGAQARRMLWQTDERGRAYYVQQQKDLRASAFNRFHLNLWAAAQSAFVDIEDWDSCADPEACRPLPGYRARRLIDDIESGAFAEFVAGWRAKAFTKQRVTVGVDASVSKDCTALVVCGKSPAGRVLLREVWIWTPADCPGGKMDYERSLTPALLLLNAVCRILRVEYDPHQLHNWATRMKKHKINMKPFPQGDQRLLSDAQLCDLIEAGLISHNGDKEIRDHVLNAAAKIDTDGRKLRIVKKGTGPIDGVVALSMGAYKVPVLKMA